MNPEIINLFIFNEHWLFLISLLEGIKFNSHESSVQRKMLKIAITGKMGSGKSSLTKIIQEQEDGYVTSYSSIIKRTLFNLDLTPTRELLQATGDFFRNYDKLVLTNQLLKEIQSFTKTINIEGIRNPFEG